MTSGKGRVLVHHGLVQAAKTRLVHHGLAQAGKTRAGGLRPSGSSTNRRTNGARRGAMSSGRLHPQLGLPRQQRQHAWHVARKKTCRPAGFADAGCATIAASPTIPGALKCPPAEPGVAGSCASLVSQTLQTPLMVEQGFLLQMHVGIGIGHQHKVEALTSMCCSFRRLRLSGLRKSQQQNWGVSRVEPGGGCKAMARTCLWMTSAVSPAKGGQQLLPAEMAV